MTIINTGENQIKWTVRKGLSSVNEDFTRSDVMLFAISQTNKIPLPITSKEKGVIVATIPQVFPATQEHPEYAHRGIQEDTYDVELVWIKNKRELNRTYQHNAFRVSDNPLIQTQTVEIVSTAQSYGYDGLSAYEIAMFRRLSEGENAICENQWLENLLAEKANTTDLNAEIINRKNADTALGSRIDSEVADRQEEDIRLSNRIQAEATARSTFDNNLIDQINDINYKIPAAASNTNKLTDKQYVYNLVNQAWDSKADKVDTYTKSEVDSTLELKANQIDLESIESKIPSQASASNQLADKEFVNSSISTNTATFRGAYNLVTDLELAINASRTTIANNIPNVVSSADNNDYVFIQIPISDEQPENIAKVERYKFNGTSWSFEYELNNSGFTAAQWAAVNSGITNNHVQKVNGLDAALAAKQDILTFDSAPTANSFNPVTSNGLYIALQNILSTSGGTINGTLTMHGNIDMLMDAQHSWNSIKTTTGRNLFCFKNGFNGYMIGDESVKLGIQTGSVDNTPTPIYHRITVNGTAVDYPILDTYNLPANVKTINGTSVAGAGNIDIDDTFKVIYNDTSLASAYQAYNDGKLIYAVVNDNEFSEVYYLYEVVLPDGSSTPTFCFYNYNAEENTVRWFEFDSEGYGEILDYGLTPINYFLYKNLSDKPSIAGVTLSGNKSLSDLGIEASNNKVTSLSSSSTDVQYPSAKAVYDEISDKQDTLISGTNIKTINNNSILGSGNISVIDASNIGSYTSSFLPLSGGSMTGNINLGFGSGNVLYASYDANDSSKNRELIKFDTISYNGNNNFRGYTYGNKKANILIETDVAGLLLHKSTNSSNNTYTIYKIFDEGNTKTINGASLIGSGNLTLEDSSNKTNDIASNASNTTKYPSCKGVVDYVDTQRFIITAGYNPEDVPTIDKTISEINTAWTAGKAVRLKFSYANSGIYFEEDVTKLQTVQNNTTTTTFVTHAVKSGTHYIVTIYEEDNTTKFSFETVLDSAKQDTISDLSTIRSGAAAGATAVQPATLNSYLALAGGTMTGDITMTIDANNDNKIKLKSDRDFLKFDSDFNGYVVGDSHIKLALETGNVDLVHKYVNNNTSTNYTVLDTRNLSSNIKTINGTSLVGSGDISTEVTTNRETSISASADNSHYPTSKAVYDYITTQLDYKENTIADLSAIRSGAEAGATAYQKPTTGIPSTDMTAEVQASLSSADTAYQLPVNGIPSTDLASAVQTSLGKADTALQSGALDSYLPKSGGDMTGNINLNTQSNGRQLLAKSDRPIISWETGNHQGNVIGNPNTRLILSSDNIDDGLLHKRNGNYYTIIDSNNLSSNIKTINGSSIVGTSGDVLLYTVSDVKTNLENLLDAFVSAGVISNYTITDPASGSKEFGFSFNNTPVAAEE